MSEPQSWNDALDKDDLTTAYLCGYRKRDDDVRALREEIAKLREVNAEQAKQIDRLSAIIRQAQQEARK